MIPSEMWWNYVPAGVSVREQIHQQIMAGRCVLLDASRLPWKDELMKHVQSAVGADDAELNWNVIDCAEAAGTEPICFLGSYFGVDRIPVARMIQQQLRQIRSCCWVRNIPESSIPAWLQLAKELFSGKEKSSFRLVLELAAPPARMTGRIVEVDTAVERFDIYYFALSILASGRLCKSFQEYASTLCAELAEGDAEMCSELCRNIDNVLKDPLSACAGRDEAQIRQLICRAQTRSISPLIDIGRLKLISILGKRIEAILPQRDDYGTVLDDVSTIELRHLVHFCGSNLLPVTPHERDMLFCLYNARNTISHLQYLPYETIRKLFQVFDELGR